MRLYTITCVAILWTVSGCQWGDPQDTETTSPVPEDGSSPTVSPPTPAPESEASHPPPDSYEASGSGEEANLWAEQGYHPELCVTMWQALALQQLDVTSASGFSLLLTNTGTSSICFDTRPLFSSTTSQTALFDPSIESAQILIEPGRSFQLGGDGMSSPHSGPDFGWWCLEKSVAATEDATYTSLGEAPPPSLDIIAADVSTDEETRQTHIWEWQERHAVFTSSKYMRNVIGGVEIHLASRNLGFQDSVGRFEDKIPAGFAVTFPYGEPDEIKVDGDGSIYIQKGIEPPAGGGSDTWVEFVYLITRAGPDDLAYLELAPALMTFHNGEYAESVQSLPAAGFNIDFSGDGVYSEIPTEVCDGIDNNQDGTIDEGFDTDEDGFTQCGGDCNDNNSGVFPDAELDEDGNTIITQVFWRDADIDGFGSDQYGLKTAIGTDCNVPPGYLPRDEDNVDCDDRVSTTFPGAEEVCNDRDDDCNSLIDDGVDADGDGFAVCDCNDSDPSSLPTGTEIPLDGIDNNCDGHDAGLIQVAAGMNHSLALDDEGHVWAWGANFFGQLGDGSPDDRATPVMVMGLRNIARIAAGWNHSLAIDQAGHLWVWGSNSQGQLGIATTIDAHVAVTVPGVEHVAEVAGGAFHTVMVTTTGEVWTWGENTSGQLGNGTTLSSMVPLKVPNLSQGAHVAAGEAHTLVAKVDGTVRAWGANDSGQLGDGTSESRTRPVTSQGLTGVVQVAAGARHSLARLDNGWVHTWGSNYQGQLGNGSQVPTTVAVWADVESVVDISAGASHNVVMDRWGQVFTWGDNDYGQVGVADMEFSLTPVQVEGVLAQDVAAGAKHSLCLQDLTTLFAWGDNSRGQLGTTIAGTSSLPGEVVLPYPSTL